MSKKTVIPRHGAAGVAVGLLVRLIVSLAYLTGLALLMPLVLLLLFSPLQTASQEGTVFFFILSFALILVGIVFLDWWSDSEAKTLQQLGTITLVPGIIALSFSFLDKETLVQFITGSLPNIAFLKEYIIYYLQQEVPQFGVLALIYLIIGGVLIGWSVRLKH